MKILENSSLNRTSPIYKNSIKHIIRAMPSPNRTKEYILGGYYHLYNRGVEKREIFLDERDYRFFISRLRRALFPVTLEEQLMGHTKGYKKHCNNICLNAYCLMPNHFHLIVQNLSDRGIESFMRSVITSYSLYFNKRYNRVGPLFQSCYKASQIKSDVELVVKVKYVHKNPLELGIGLADLKDYPYSNYGNYISGKEEPWFNTRTVLQMFNNTTHNYKEFLEMD